MNVGDNVAVIVSCDRYDGRCRGCQGVIRRINRTWANPYEVKLYGLANPASITGNFYFSDKDLIYWGYSDDLSVTTTVEKDSDPFTIKNVYFNDPVTVVMWNDGTKTIVRCSENDYYDPEKGLAMAIIKKVYGNDNSFHKIFKKWLPKEDAAEPVGFEEFFANLRRILLGEE